MKSNEFRIGNFVHHNEQNIKTNFINDFLIVCEIDENNINTYYINIDKNKQIVRGKVGYKPIPLTDEWLVKFGAEKTAISYIFHINKNDNLLLEHRSYDSSSPTKYDAYVGYDFEYGTIPLKIEYVHQLQNLYFVLTGHELQYTQAGGV